MSAVQIYMPDEPIENTDLIISGQHPYHEQMMNALVGFEAHLLVQKSENTPEKYTRRNYYMGLKFFMDFIGDRLPTPQLMQWYIAYLKRDKGLASSTVNTNYLAPTRLFLRNLALEFMDDQYNYARINESAKVQGPPDEISTSIAPAYNPKFKRLKLDQVNATLRKIDRDTLAGLRDYALLQVAFNSALRLSAMRRLTLADFTEDDGCYIITVRDKRNNYDPIPVDITVYNHVMAYVNAYNEALDGFNDPRRITKNTPIWRSLLGQNRPMPLNHRHSRPKRGMSDEAIRALIARRTAQGCGIKLAAHDTRRTAATILFEAGMPLHEISALLRHKEVATTLKYIGIAPQVYNTRTAARYATFG